MSTKTKKDTFVITDKKAYQDLQKDFQEQIAKEIREYTNEKTKKDGEAEG